MGKLGHMTDLGSGERKIKRPDNLAEEYAKRKKAEKEKAKSKKH